ncbi:MAG: glutathione S-transferase family protein [Pseudomonadota bacterium]
MTTPVLYIGNKNYSSWSLRPWLVFEHFGLPFEEKLIPLFDDKWDAAIAEVSPSHKVPCLVDGDLTIWETLAIIEYATDRHPQAAIWPDGFEARAVARSVACEMHAGFADLRSAMPMNIRKSLPGRGHTPGALNDVAQIQERWNRCRGDYGSGGDFLFGAFSAADAMYAPVASRLLTYGVDLDPVSSAYVDAIVALPAMQAWSEAARQEPWVIAEEELD